MGWVNFTRIRSTAEHYVNALSINTPSLSQRVKNLSGGNQQKVVVSKWLTADTEILIFDEPTRGIDVGAKSEIYRLLNDLAHEGKAIIMMCEGRVTGELAGEDATQEKIMTLATQREKAA